MDLPYLVRNTGVIQDALSDSGLTSVNMRKSGLTFFQVFVLLSFGFSFWLSFDLVLRRLMLMTK